MNFKLKTLSLLLAGAALSMSSCQSDSPLDNGGGSKDDSVNSGKYVHITAGIALPSSSRSRSATDDTITGSGNDQTNSDQDKQNQEDFEYGYDYENDVRSMILVIADKDDKYITHTVISGITQVPSSSSKFDFTVTGEIKYEDLENAYKSGGLLASYNPTTDDIHLYAFCNYTNRLLNLFTDPTSEGETDYSNWMNWAGKVEESASPAGQTPSITNTIWAPRSFLMTNASVTTAKFPESIDEWDPYTDKSNPLDLTTSDGKANPIKVERVAGRFDFRDGSNYTTSSGKQANTYPILSEIRSTTVTGGQSQTTQSGPKNLYSIRLTRMSLVNMSKNFYYLRRVSADGQNTGSTIGGAETSKNYVVDTDAATKSTIITETDGATAAGNANQYFNFTLYNSDGSAYNRDGWYSDNIEYVLSNSSSDDTWSGSSTNRYKIWRYVTENTIPKATGTDVNPEANQQTVRSTGIVFKGKIIIGQDGLNDTGDDQHPYLSDAVKEALTKSEAGADADSYTYPVLYCYDGLLFAGVKELVQAGIDDGEGGTIYAAVNNTLKNWKLSGTEYKFGEGDGEELTIVMANDILNNGGNYSDGENKGTAIGRTINWGTGDSEYETFNTTVPKYGVTVYKASNESDGDGWGYYCYYFYWNRHNDNDRSNKMGVMEFATVRNNVYKLSVTEISDFGHPRIKEYDPEPEEPWNPDEKPKAFIKVNVEVLPWVVRENNITF